MPDKKKRFSVYLTDEQCARIKARSAHLGKRSMGEYIMELVDQDCGVLPAAPAEEEPDDRKQ